jgi:hypothetical protein
VSNIYCSDFVRGIFSYLLRERYFELDKTTVDIARCYLGFERAFKLLQEYEEKQGLKVLFRIYILICTEQAIT